MTPRPAPVDVDVRLDPDSWRAEQVAEVRRSLSGRPRTLSPVWFYDDRGSQLFDEITRLPEYYLTRAERRLLARSAPDIAEAADAVELVELGSGTSDKTEVLLDALVEQGLTCYRPLDVSEQTLREAAERIAHRYPGLVVRPIVGDFLHHLDANDAIEGDGARLVAFLGSTIGNLNPAERARFLFDLDCAMVDRDRLLLGVDLVKEPDRLLAAYDDATGVTASFNRNALAVLNQELGADFDPDRFSHRAVWDPQRQWIEMRLVAEADHTVRIPEIDLELRLAAGEEIRTEISAKFTRDGLAEELLASGFVIERSWEDPEGYLLVLARPWC